MSRFAKGFWLFGLLMIIVGCVSGNKGEEVSGTINFKGKPLEAGAITFVPESQDPGYFSRMAVITQGKYTVPAQEGLKPGPYVVKITAGEATKKVKEDEPPGEAPPAKQLIPAKYNEMSTIIFEVKAGQKNTFNQDIP